MKRVRTTILLVVLIIFATYVIGVAAESVLMKNNQQNLNNEYDKLSFFDAKIIFTILINDGCGCNPIEGATIVATGGAGYEENVTGIDGTCVLQLEINSIYTISITAENYIPIIFEFDIIDDQFFNFQMTLIDDSAPTIIPVTHNTIDIFNR